MSKRRLASVGGVGLLLVLAGLAWHAWWNVLGMRYKKNVTIAETLALGISRDQAVNALGQPIRLDHFDDDARFEILYFATPPIYPEQVAVIVEVRTQRVVAIRAREGQRRVMEGHQLPARHW